MSVSALHVDSQCRRSGRRVSSLPNGGASGIPGTSAPPWDTRKPFRGSVAGLSEKSQYTPVRSFLTLANGWNAECYVEAHGPAHCDADRIGQSRPGPGRSIPVPDGQHQARLRVPRVLGLE